MSAMSGWQCGEGKKISRAKDKENNDLTDIRNSLISGHGVNCASALTAFYVNVLFVLLTHPLGLRSLKNVSKLTKKKEKILPLERHLNTVLIGSSYLLRKFTQTVRF